MSYGNDWRNFWDSWDYYHYGAIEGPALAPWGDSITLVAHPNHGYKFVQWKYPSIYDTTIFDTYTNDSIHTHAIRYQYTADTVLSYIPILHYDEFLISSAEFAKKRYWVAAESENYYKGGARCFTGDYHPHYFDYGDSVAFRYTVNFRASPSNGYFFTHWSDGDTNINRSITITQDTNLIAYFEGIPLSVSVTNSTPELGTATGSGNYRYGDTIELTAIPTEHYHFHVWKQGNQLYYDNPLTIVLSQDTVFEVIFEIDQHHVEVAANNIAYGSVYGTNDYYYGSAASIGAHPYSGYQFVRWSNGVTYNPYTFAVLSDTSLTAIFAEEGTAYTISVESADLTMGEVSGGSIYTAGEQATLTAFPFSGYVFDHWQDNNTDNPRTITITGDSSFTAYFTTTQGIEDYAYNGIKVYSTGGQIVVEFGLDDEIGIYDMYGRKVDGGRKARFDVPSSGVYFVKTGALPTQKVVVIR